MIVAITGGTGFLGSHLARGLTANGHHVKLLARGLNKKNDSIKKLPNAAFVPMIFTDDKLLMQALNGCDAVAHLIGINREENKGDFQRVHVESTVHILHNARRAGIKKIILVSYLRARNTRFSAYHKSKWDAEQLIRASDLDYTIFKPGVIYGPGDHMVDHISRAINLIPFVGVFPTVGVLEKKLSPIAIEDMVKVMIAALTEGRLARQTVAVTGPEELKLSECVWRVAKAMGKPTVVLPVPAFIQTVIASSMEKGMGQPIVSVAQVSMLAEGMSNPLPDSEVLPSDLLPTTKFTQEQIKLALP